MDIYLYYGLKKSLFHTIPTIIKNVDSLSFDTMMKAVDSFIIDQKGGEYFYTFDNRGDLMNCNLRTVHTKDYKKITIFENEFSYKTFSSKEDLLIYIASICERNYMFKFQGVI